MIEVAYKPAFLRAFKKLSPALQTQTRDAIAAFKKRTNHKRLDVHKLRGTLHNVYSFSVNHRYRIIFQWETEHLAVLLIVGDHDVYR